MKSSLIKFRRILFSTVIFAGFTLSPCARAGLTLQLDIIHNVAGGVYTLAPNLSLNTNVPDSTPLTYHEVYSPFTNASGIANFTGGVGTNSTNTRDDFPDSNFAAFMQAVTNGTWKLVMNVGATNEHTYTFTVRGAGFSSNQFINAVINYPQDGDTNVPPLPTFEFHGPTNTDILLVYVISFSSSLFQYTYPDVSATNAIVPPALTNGDYLFVTDYTKDISTLLTSSTPLDASNHAATGWISTAQADDGNQSSFTVVVPPLPPPPTGHTNIGYYQFDDAGRLGLDSSTNGNNIDAYTGWTGTNGTLQDLTTNAIAGGGAVQFFGDTAMVAVGQTFTNLTAALAGSFSVSLWVNASNILGNNSDDLDDNSGQTIFYDSFFSPGMSIGITGSAIAFLTKDPDGHADTLHSVSSITYGGRYVHVAVTRNQTTGEKVVYIDGVRESSDTASTESLTGNGFLTIGGEQGTPFTGLVDDLQIYTGVLSDSEVSYLHANPGTVLADTTPAEGELGIALNATNFFWTTSGDASWFAETNVTFDGVSAVQSGSLIDSQTTVLQTTVVGPGTITFYWQCIGDGDSIDLEFDINGSEMAVIDTFESNWFQESFPLGAGTNVLTWTAFTGIGSSTNDAGYVDEFVFTSAQVPAITLNPFDQTNYSGYSVCLLANATGNPTPNWQWYKNNVAVAGATNAIYIPADSGSNSVVGHYYAIASNYSGFAITTTNTVTFVSAPLPPDWSIAFKSESHVPSDIAFYPYFFDLLKDYYYNCSVDSTGNLYVAAEFSNTNAFGTNILIPGPGGNAAAIVKQSPDGTGIWIQAITNNGNGHAQTLSVTPAPGDGVYAVGNFTGTNWLGTNQLADAGLGSIFIARFAANGSNIWIKAITNTDAGFVHINSLVSDASGNVTLIESFQFTGYSTATMMQYDATGNLRWSQSLPSDTFNLVYAAGCLYASAYNPTGSVVIGGVHIVTDRRWTLAALSDTNGQVLWLTGVGAPLFVGSSDGLFDDAPVIAASAGSVFVVGRAYGNTATFGTNSVSWTGNAGNYVARYDTSGNPQLATGFGSETTTPIAAVAIPSGGFYVTGDFDDFSYFGQKLIAAPDYGSAFTNNFSQTFVAKFDANGNPLWARLARANFDRMQSSFVNAFGIALASDGVWVSSVFRPRVSFGANIFNGNPLYFDGNLILDDYDSGALAKITDAVATVSPVSLINPQLLGTNFQFSFTSTSGHTNTVQYSTDLSTHSWLPYTNLPGDGALKTITVPANNPTQKYFRVITQ